MRCLLDTHAFLIEQALFAPALPLLHRDPFDRLLIAQASTEKMALITADHAFAAYDVQVVWRRGLV